MKKYKKQKSPSPAGRVHIRGDIDNMIISMSYSLLPAGRVNLFLDEVSFNIHIIPDEKGALRICKSKDIPYRRILYIDGFMRMNKLESEDILGDYYVKRTPQSVVILYNSRDRGEYIEPKTKITIVLPRDMKREWKKHSNGIGISNFVRNAVNRYIEDNRL